MSDLTPTTKRPIARKWLILLTCIIIGLIVGFISGDLSAVGHLVGKRASPT